MAAFALLGLFAMHGLASHGGNGPSVPASNAPGPLSPEAHAAGIAVGITVDQSSTERIEDLAASRTGDRLSSVTNTVTGTGTHAGTCPCDDDSTHTSPHADGGEEHGGHSLAIGLCLALIGVAFALLLTRSRLRPRNQRDRAKSPHRVRMAALAALARPPDLTALGVCRC